MCEKVKIHHLTLTSVLFQEMEVGNLDFTIRNKERGFAINDIVVFHETIDTKKTGRKAPPRKICYIFDGGVYGLSFDNVVFQTKKIGTLKKPIQLIPDIDLCIAEAVATASSFSKIAEDKNIEINKTLAAGFFLEGYDYAKSILDHE